MPVIPKHVKKIRKDIIQQTGWYVLHPSMNATGSDTLRWSHSNPNSANISKQEDFNLRYMFGPSPGREWWSLDYENIELRIPAYESGEQVMIDIFERPNDPPFFGSYHLLNASIIYPDLFWPLAEKKGEFKKRYAATWYQWVKNFGFAFSYGCMEETGDRTAHRNGSYRLVKNKLKEHSRLNQSMLDYADRWGYVETIPDKDIDPSRGYPLLCSRTSYGKILPTIPLNFHVQGTACWVVMRAMTKVQHYLDELNHKKDDYFLIMNVHDELVLDFPYVQGQGNLPKVKRIRQNMAAMGDPIDVPLTVGISYHQDNWSEGVTCA